MRSVRWRQGQPKQRRVALVLLGACLAVFAPRTWAAYRPNDPIPTDSSVTIGTLSNGLTYYVRRNGWPQNRVELRLAVLAGSVLEDEDQRGLAHFVEHMGFNGSAHFPPGEVERYFETIGARWGADLNAGTNFDQTIYQLDLPAVPESLVERGVTLLGDFAARVSFPDSEVEKERGVVLEEWRGDLGAGERMNRILLPVLFQGSRYAGRLPIGEPDIIRNAPTQRLRDFYTRWYRPERMAVCIVGSIEPARAIELIQKSFGDIPPSRDLEPLPRFDVPPNDKILYGIATDPEARSSSVALILKRRRPRFRILSDFRANYVRSLLYGMLNQRFQELARTPDAPFVGASAGASSLGKMVRTFQLSASVQEGRIDAGLRALALEVRRARTQGFGAAELERTKSAILANAERAVRERDRTENRSLVSGCVASFTDSLPLTSADQRLRMLRDVLPTIELADVAAALEELMHDEGRIVIVQAPEKAGLKSPTEEELQNVLAAVDTMTLQPWYDKVAGRELLPSAPTPGSIRARRTVPEVGVTVLTLSNGVEVYLKPTDFKKDEILVSAYSFGGASRVDPKHYQELGQAVGIVREAGFGGLTPVETSKLLAGKLVGMAPYMGDYSHGIGGSSSPQDLETALQLLYIQFAGPNDRPEGLEIVRKRLRTQIENRAADPDAAFSDEVSKVNSNDHYMSRPLDMTAVEALRFEPALDFYRESFRNAADFTFFFVGAFDPTVLEPLLEKYVASLPSQGKRKMKYRDRNYRFPKAVVTSVVHKGREPQSSTELSYFADPGRDRVERVRVRAVTDILEIRLREILREDLGATYSVSVSFADLQPLPGYGLISIDFGGAPENRDRMVKATEDEVERMKAQGVAEADVAKFTEISRRELEVNEKTNGWWMGQLRNGHQLGWDPRSIAAARARIDAVTRPLVNATAKKYLPASRHTVVSVLPETTARPDSTSTGGSEGR